MAGTSLHDAIEYEVPELAEGEPVPRPPAGSPPELKIRWEAPMPIVASRADLDLPHHPDATERGGACQHRLVTIGDSISQGFKSLAISETSLSWPAMVAHELGLDETGFTYPTFPGPDEAPGLPLNLEALFRTLESASGGRSLRTHEIKAAEAIADVARSVAAYWERLDGAVPLPPAASFHHNLAVTGYDVRDSIGKTSSWLEQAMTPEALRTHFVQRVAKDLLRRIGNEFSTSYAEERIALRTLNGPDQDTTQVSAAKWLGDHGGIETLVVALGANNALGVVLSLQLHWTGPGYDDLAQKDAYNLWAPDHFEHEYALLVDQLRGIDAKHVILATVPHVTIVPITRGVGDKPYYSRYFARYTRPWISDADFDPSVHPCITGDEARAVDAAIDQYNYFIKRAVRDARLGQGAHADDPRDWYLFDLCGVLDRLAYRRYLTSPQTQPGWFAAVRTARGHAVAVALARHPLLRERRQGSDPRWPDRARRRPPEHHRLHDHRSAGDRHHEQEGRRAVRRPPGRSRGRRHARPRPLDGAGLADHGSTEAHQRESPAASTRSTTSSISLSSSSGRVRRRQSVRSTGSSHLPGSGHSTREQPEWRERHALAATSRIGGTPCASAPVCRVARRGGKWLRAGRTRCSEGVRPGGQRTTHD